MKKIIYGAALALALSGCSSKEVDINDVNKFLSDLSEVYVGDFAGPNPDDFIKIDFAVKRLLIESPDVFEKQGSDLAVSADKVHAMSDKYFNYPIANDESSNDVDYTKDGKYVIMPMDAGLAPFSKATKIAQKADTILYDVDVYNRAEGSEPEKYKTMRAVLLTKDDGLRVISYMVK